MGWKCDKCGNTEDFTEVNTVNTKVTQEKGSTRILKIKNQYRADGATNVWCNRCDSEEVSWVEVPDQDSAYLNAK
jgi:DNA-directed RNA polymerase subunit M/transcription elongation factor TFIIS